MIGFFPEPYPDELLFSIVSRYAELTDYQAVARLTSELFGSKRLRLPVAIPSNLTALVARLPPGHHFSVKRLVNDHTLLPFFGPFISNDRYRLVRRDMATNRGAPLYGRLGINNFRSVLKYFRYCPQCVVEDRKKFRITYWHRLHHIPSIDLCSVHGLYLNDSDVFIKAVNRASGFVTAEASLEGAELSSQTEENEHFRAVQTELALNASWLLEHRGSSGYSHNYRDYYIKLLYERGLCTFAGTAKRRSLVSELTSFFSDDLLKRLKCEVDSTTGTDKWVIRLLYRTDRALHPIHHLLMLQFLGTSARDLIENTFSQHSATGMKGYCDPKPFGSGPWPCLNTTAEHFKQDVVVVCEVLPTQNSPRPPRGIFRCSCGFAYSRIGPDKSADDRYRLERYISFGAHWDNTVKAMVRSGWAIKKIAQTLKMGAQTVRLQLGRLDVRAVLQRTSPTSSKQEDRRRSRYDMEKMRELQRSKLLAIRNENPKLSRSKIHKRWVATYQWLYVHDKDWLFANLPPKMSPSEKPPRQSKWLVKDVELAEAVKAEVARLRAMPGRPEVISKTAISRNLGILHVWSKRRQVLPLTNTVLESVRETSEEFAVRLVEWAAASFAERGLSPTRGEIIDRASLSSRSLKTSTVKAAIERAVGRLESQMDFHYSDASAA